MEPRDISATALPEPPQPGRGRRRAHFPSRQRATRTCSGAGRGGGGACSVWNTPLVYCIYVCIYMYVQIPGNGYTHLWSSERQRWVFVCPHPIFLASPGDFGARLPQAPPAPHGISKSLKGLQINALKRADFPRLRGKPMCESKLLLPDWLSWFHAFDAYLQFFSHSLAGCVGVR